MTAPASIVVVVVVVEVEAVVVVEAVGIGFKLSLHPPPKRFNNEAADSDADVVGETNPSFHRAIIVWRFSQ